MNAGTNNLAAGKLTLAVSLLVAAVGLACPNPNHPREQAQVVWSLIGDDGQLPGGLTCFGCQAKMTVTCDDGRSLAHFRYNAVRSQVAGFAVEGIKLPQTARTLYLRARPSEGTSIALNLIEHGGAVYQAFAWLPPGQWTDLQIPLREFWLAENCTDPDGRLDPSKVRSFRLLDLANLPGQVGRALGLKDGPQELTVAQLAVTTAEAQGRSRMQEARALVDDFAGPPLLVLPIGQPRLKFERVAGRPALAIEYVLGRYRWAGVVRGVGHLPVARAVAIAFQACVMPSARVQIVAEERDGSKYASNVVLRGGVGWRPVRVRLAEMTLVQGSKDENRKLDPDQLRVVIIVVDTFSTPLKPGARGRLWLRDLALEFK